MALDVLTPDEWGDTTVAEVGSDLRSVTTTLAGIAGAPGVGMGVAVVVYPPADLDTVPERLADDVETEIKSFETALAGARAEIKRGSRRLASHLPPGERALFDAYLQILDDRGLGKEVIQEICDGQWAQGALARVIKRHQAQFAAMDDAYLRERAADLRDLGRCVLSHLQQNDHAVIDYPHHTVLAGMELSLADLARVPSEKLVAVVCSTGASYSHVAILAKALGVPAVMGLQGLPVQQLDGQSLIVDGYYGHVIASPSATISREYAQLVREECELTASLQALVKEPAVTTDGHSVHLFVNSGLNADIAPALQAGAEGVGLYRTEVPFMIRDTFPDEEQQLAFYREVLSSFLPRPVVMRTLDIGGDKTLPYFPIEEPNPFLGWRGIRVSLTHPDMFSCQLRAMIRASEGLDNLSLLLPMVAHLSEVEDALGLLQRAYEEVLATGAKVVMPKVGVMVEVPAAVYQARAFAKRVDFISVGSNDLTQYLLAVDRSNTRVANLYDGLHPAVLVALRQIVEGVHLEGKPVSICGELAGDPAAVIVLLAMGFDTLSASASNLLRMKAVIRKISMNRARVLLGEVLAMEDAPMVRAHLENALDELGLGGFIRAGKR